MNIKKENDDLGKQANKLANLLQLRTYIKHCITVTIILFCSINLHAQDITYNTGKKYILGDVTVSGNSSFSAQTIVTYSGLSKGKEMNIPGEEISTAIKKLWNSKLFSDIEIYIIKIEGNVAYLEIRISFEENPLIQHSFLILTY